MRKALGLILSPLLLSGSVVASSLVAPQLTSVAQAQVNNKCTARLVAKTLKSNPYYGISTETLEDYRDNRPGYAGFLAVPANDSRYIVIQTKGTVVRRDQKAPLGKVEVTVRGYDTQNADKGQIVNAVVLALRIQGRDATGCGVDDIRLENVMVTEVGDANGRKVKNFKTYSLY